MATPAGERATGQYRRGLLVLEGTTIRQLAAVWTLLDSRRVVATTDTWVTAALAIVAAQHARSVELAAAYFQAFRRAEVGVPYFAPLPIPTFNRQAAATSLIVSGPVRMRKATPATHAQLERIAQVEVGRAGSRHALNGGRELVRQASLADPRARGWGRVTSGKACKFCSMLAGRGAVYSEATVDFQAHDGCHCTAQPAY